MSGGNDAQDYNAQRIQELLESGDDFDVAYARVMQRFCDDFVVFLNAELKVGIEYPSLTHGVAKFFLTVLANMANNIPCGHDDCKRKLLAAIEGLVLQRLTDAIEKIAAAKQEAAALPPRQVH